MLITLRSKQKIPSLDSDIERIFPLIHRSSGIDFSLYKPPTLKRAIQKRIHALKLKDINQYVNHLERNKKEAKTLSDTMLIRVTGFFRDPDVFKVLKKRFFPQFVKTKSHDPIRIWVPGCCTGEEVYSLAIALMDYFTAKRIVPPPLQLFGTDLNEEALNKARSGIYSKKDIQGVNPAFLRHYFKKVNHHYQIDKNIRSSCTFAKQDLAHDPPFSKLDLVSCRNVLIYLKSETQEKIVKIFHYSLKPSGFLLLGKSENIGILHPSLFNLMDKNHSVYTKKNLVAHPEFPFRFNSAYLKNPTPDLRATFHPPYEFDVSREIDRLLIERTSHAAVLINESNEMVQIRGDVSAYLRMPAGKTTLDVLKLAHEDFSIELKMMLEKAKKRLEPVHKIIQSDPHEIELEILPLQKSFLKEKYFLIIFNSKKSIVPPPELADRKRSSENKKVNYLRQELLSTKAWMQNILEEHECTIQELRSAHEEVLSSNEELQSLNEELQTAKEELDSTNEELTTVNEELQKQIEKVRESEEKFKLLVQSIADYAIFMLDSKGHVATWNIGAERIKGYKAVEIIGSHFSVFYPKEDQEKPAKELRDAAKTGVFKEDSWRVRKDGSKFWASIVITALKDEFGKPKGFVNITRDMTEPKRSEELLRRNEEYIRSILQTSNDAYISMDMRGIIIEWNQRAGDMFGLDRGAAIGHPLKDTIIPMRFRQAHEKGLERFLRTGVGPVMNKTIELSALHRKGHEFPVELTLWPTKFDDQFHFHAFIRDISERKKTEAALQKAYGELEKRVEDRTKELQVYSEELVRSNADLQQFAFIASHDLQEPLRMVSMYVDLLGQHLQGSLKSDAKEYMRFVQEGAMRAQRLINELLEYSRIGTKGQNFPPTLLGEVLRHVLSLLEVSIKENNATVTFNPLPMLPADRFQMEQLFQNLISNAMKYHTKEPIKIHITAEKRGVEWLFSVSDNGIGIDPKYHETIFVIFKRLHAAKDYPGTGIGLALCKKIVEWHGGKIWVESKPGAGSTFFFTLPEKRD